MINLTIGDLKEINQLLTMGKLDSALQEAKKLENSEKANQKIKNKARLIKALILNKLGLYKSALEQTHAILNSINSQDLWMIVNTKVLSAYSLIQMNKTTEAKKIIGNTLKDIQKSNPQAIDFQQQKKAELNLLKGLLLEKENKLDESLKLYLQALSTLREIDDQYGTAEALNLTGRIYFKKGDTIRSLVIYEQCLEIFQKLNNNKEIACVLNQVGLIYLWKGEYGPALEHCLQSLAIRQELNYQKDIANSFYSISDIYFHLGELNRSLEYLQKSLSISEELDSQLDIGLAITALSKIFYQKGELQQAMIYNQQAQDILQRTANEQYLASALQIQGKILTKQGNVEQALEIFKECLSIRDKYDDKKDISYLLFWLILLNVENKSLNQAQLYLQRLKIIHERQPNNIIDKQYRLASGLVLKHSLSPEIIDTSTKLFKEVVDGNITDYHIKTIGLYYLCELLINEYKYYGNYEALHTVEVLINKHLQMAEQIESQIMIADNFWLKAQLAKAKEKTRDATIFLNQAQQVTEEIGYLQLAAKITSFRQLLGEGLDHDSQSQSHVRRGSR
jgi:tetratricopeptide (TPR) repeat protein